jgi:hypothetical protein
VSDVELHHQLVKLYAIMLDHLKATKEIEATLALLISLDPKLQEHIASAQHPKPQGAAHSDDELLEKTDELLLQVQRIIRELNRQS